MTSWLDGVGADARYGARMLTRHSLLAALSVVTLALGIGANAAIFSISEAVLLRPLPYPAADRLVVLLDGRMTDRTATTPTIPELLDVRESVHGLDGITFFDMRDFQIAGGSEPQRVVGARLEPTFFSLAGVTPALGRLFDETDRRDDNPATVVLGSGLWRRNFGADPGVVGRALIVDGAACRIIGVLPDSFSFAFLSSASVDLFLPYSTSSEYLSRAGQFANVRRVNAIGRMAPGASIETVNAELAVTSAAIAAAHPDLYTTRGRTAAGGLLITASPLQDVLTQSSRPKLLLLFGAVGLLLLVACVNTAQFLLAQALEREPELALRAALGASQARLIRQAVTEALLLAGAGGIVSLAPALWLIRGLTSLMPPATPVVGRIGLDPHALGFMAVATLVTAIASVLAPALRIARGRVMGRLRTRGMDGGRGRLRSILIATEVGVSLVLLVGTGLLLRSLFELQRAQGGFTADGVSVLRMRGMSSGTGTGELGRRYLEQIGRVPGVQAAAMSSGALPGGPGTAFTILGEGSNSAAVAQQRASYLIVSGSYFAALGIPLEAGRIFTEDDAPGRAPVAIVNRELARRFFADQPALGRQIRAGDGPRAATMTIVGIVGNVRPPFQTGDVPQIYVSYRQQGEPNIVLTVRTAPGAAPPIAAVKQAIWRIEPRQAVFDVKTLPELLSQRTANQRAIAILIGGFATLALAMSIVGVYTVITYLVSRRFKEIAIRRAIGASGRDLLWSLARPTLVWTIGGLVAGGFVAVSGGRALRAAVDGVLPLDPALTVAVSASYLAIVLLVIAAAARGALRIDPIVALRAE